MKLSTWLCCLSGLFITITVYCLKHQHVPMSIINALFSLVLLLETFKECCSERRDTCEEDITWFVNPFETPLTNEPETCCICLDDLISEIVITSCQHKYHKQCLSTWFSYKRSCPLCSKMIITHVDPTNQSH